MADDQGSGQYLPVNNSNSSRGGNGQPRDDNQKQFLNVEVFAIPDQEMDESQAQPPSQNIKPASNHPMPSGPVAQNSQQSPSARQPTTPILPSHAPQQTVTISPASTPAPGGQPEPSNSRKRSRQNYTPEFKADLLKKIQADMDEKKTRAYVSAKSIAEEHDVPYNTLYYKWWPDRKRIQRAANPPKKSHIIQFIQQRWTFETNRQALLASAARNFRVGIKNVSIYWDKRDDPGGFGIKEKVNSFLRENGTHDFVLVDAVCRFEIPLETVLNWTQRGAQKVIREVLEVAVIELFRETNPARGSKKRVCRLFGVGERFVRRILTKEAETVEQKEQVTQTVEQKKWEPQREEVLEFLRKEKAQGTPACWRRTCDRFGIPYSVVERWWCAYKMKEALETWDQQKEEVLKVLEETQSKNGFLTSTSKKFDIPHQRVFYWWMHQASGDDGTKGKEDRGMDSGEYLDEDGEELPGDDERDEEWDADIDSDESMDEDVQTEEAGPTTLLHGEEGPSNEGLGESSTPSASHAELEEWAPEKEEVLHFLREQEGNAVDAFVIFGVPVAVSNSWWDEY